jgi:hypothetical protein
LFVCLFVYTNNNNNNNNNNNHQTQHRIHQPSLSQFYITTICNYYTHSSSLRERELFMKRKESHQTLSLSHFTLFILLVLLVCVL